MKIIFLILLASIVFFSCSGDESTTETIKEGQDKNAEANKKDTAYHHYIKRNGIKSLSAKGYAYKFGEISGDGNTLYEVNYNEDGYVLDSIIYNDNKVIASLNNVFDDANRLLVSMIKDSVGVVQQKVERSYDTKGNVLTFQLIQQESILYSQKMTYDEDRMTKIVEFDKDGNPRIVTNYDYNENGKLITNQESDEAGNLLKKTSFVYDKDGNNSIQTIYNSKGQVAEKNFLKNYDALGNAKLIEKYDANDSLVVTYQYEYNDKGKEIKSIIFDGVGQIIRQSMASFDQKGNQVGYEVFEGGKGFVGKDAITYNEKDQEQQLIVYDKDSKQVKRKTTSYNDKDLREEVVNFDKLDEPIFRISFSYTYFQ